MMGSPSSSEEKASRLSLLNPGTSPGTNPGARCVADALSDARQDHENRLIITLDIGETSLRVTYDRSGIAWIDRRNPIFDIGRPDFTTMTEDCKTIAVFSHRRDLDRDRARPEDSLEDECRNEIQEIFGTGRLRTDISTIDRMIGFCRDITIAESPANAVGSGVLGIDAGGRPWSLVNLIIGPEIRSDQQLAELVVIAAGAFGLARNPRILEIDEETFGGAFRLTFDPFRAQPQERLMARKRVFEFAPRLGSASFVLDLLKALKLD